MEEMQEAVSMICTEDACQSVHKVKTSFFFFTRMIRRANSRVKDGGNVASVGLFLGQFSKWFGRRISECT